MLDAECKAQSTTSGVVSALDWTSSPECSPFALVIFWIVRVLASGVSPVALGVVVGSTCLLLVLAPRARRRA